MNDNDAHNRPNRREFLRQGAWGATLAGLGAWLSVPSIEAQAQRATSSRKLGKEFTYDLRSLQFIDPKLYLYDLKSSFKTGLKKVEAIAMMPGDACAMSGDKSIVLFDVSGQRQSAFSIDEAARALFWKDDVLFVGLKDRVALYSRSGQRQAIWDSLGKKALITSIAVGEKDVFAADAGNRVVWHYDRSGKLLGSLGRKTDPKPHRFIVPSPYFDVQIGPDGLLWVANPGEHQLHAFTFDGDLEYTWGETSVAIQGFCGCCNPVHFSIFPDGRFVTSEKGLTRIKIYSPKGQFEGVVAGPEAFPQLQDNTSAKMTGIALAIDSQGQVLTVDPVSGEVKTFRRRLPSS